MVRVIGRTTKGVWVQCNHVGCGTAVCDHCFRQFPGCFLQERIVCDKPKKVCLECRGVLL